MTDLLPRSRTHFVLDVTVNGQDVDLEAGGIVITFDTAEEAVDALRCVLDTMLNSGQQVKVLKYLAEGGWVGRFQHYGGGEPSLWHATYREQSIDE